MGKEFELCRKEIMNGERKDESNESQSKENKRAKRYDMFHDVLPKKISPGWPSG